MISNLYVVPGNAIVGISSLDMRQAQSPAMFGRQGVSKIIENVRIWKCAGAPVNEIVGLSISYIRQTRSPAMFERQGVLKISESGRI